MSQFEEHKQELAEQQFLTQFFEIVHRRRQQVRKMGYDYYDRPRQRWNRFLRSLHKKPVVSREIWYQLVDAIVDSRNSKELRQLLLLTTGKLEEGEELSANVAEAKNLTSP